MILSTAKLSCRPARYNRWGACHEDEGIAAIENEVYLGQSTPTTVALRAAMECFLLGNLDEMPFRPHRISLTVEHEKVRKARLPEPSDRSLRRSSPLRGVGDHRRAIGIDLPCPPARPMSGRRKTEFR